MPTMLAQYLLLAPRSGDALLVFTSLGFYAWGAPAVLLVFIGSIGSHYAAGLLIGPRRALGGRALGARGHRRRDLRQPREAVRVEVRGVATSQLDGQAMRT
jgi:hypothetical protein